MRTNQKLGGRAMRLAAVWIIAVMYLLGLGPAAEASSQIVTWAKMYPGERYAFFADQTADNGFIVASDIVISYHSYPWIYKLDANGNMGWQKAFDKAHPGIVRATADGGYIAAGSYSPDGYGNVAMAMKLDAQGAIVWQKSYGTFSGNAAYSFGFSSIRPTADGGYIAAGSALNMEISGYSLFVVKLDANGGIEWQKRYSGAVQEYLTSVEQTADGGYIMAATVYSLGSAGSGAWLVKLDSGGGIEWQKTFSNLGGGERWRTNYGRVVQQTADGGYAFVTTTQLLWGGPTKIWVVKLDAAGVIEWQKAYGGAVNDSGASIDQTADGGYIVGGSTQSFGAGDLDSIILRLDAAGGIVWQRSFGGPGYDWFYQVRQTGDGGYAMSGWDWSFSGTYWIFKLDENGSISGCAADFMGTASATSADTHALVRNSSVVPVDLSLSSADLNETTFDLSASSQPVCQDPSPVISVSPAAIDFGAVELGGSAMRSITITNTGGSDLAISSIAVQGASSFSRMGSCTAVAPNASCSVDVSFSPATWGSQSAGLTIVSSDPSTPTITVPLSGTGADTIAPVTTASVSGTAGSNGWFRSAVTVSLGAADAGSGVQEIRYSVDNGAEAAVAGASATTALAADGLHAIVYYAKDRAGNTETSQLLEVKIDATPPAITAAASPAPNAAGWNNSDVTVAFTCVDAVSGAASCTGPAVVTVEGTNQVVAGAAVDRAGNTATASVTLNIDKTPPSVTATVTPAAAKGRRHKKDVIVTFACNDTGSGVATCPSPVTVTRTRTDQVVTGTATDRAGNQSTATATIAARHGHERDDHDADEHDDDDRDDREHDKDHKPGEKHPFAGSKGGRMY